MGICSSCFQNSKDDEQNHNINHSSQPNRERLRQLQAEAAEKRMRENESRGIQNIDHVRQQQAKRDRLEQLERNANENSMGGGGLKWQVS